jgi:hypothetical protein
MTNKPPTLYKLIHNTPEKINSELTQSAMGGWKPILMTTEVTTGNIINVFVILEHLPG